MKFAATICAIALGLTSPAMATEAPQTLFTISGVKPEAAKLSNSVLVIIDAQREYVDGALPLTRVNDAISEIAKLLARARKARVPVIHVVHKGKGKLFNPENPGFEIVTELKPLPNERVIEKTHVSAFADTGLEDAIQRTGRKNLIIVGFMTHNCVNSTARTAMDKGYPPTIVAAATATRDLPDVHGRVIPAEILQTVTLAELADRNAVVVPKAGSIAD